MTLSQGQVWALYVAGGLVLTGAVAAGALANRSDPPVASNPGPTPPSSITVSIPGTPSPVYPHQSSTSGSPERSCAAVVAVDAENVSRQFVLAVGEAYAATPQSRQCAAASVEAYSEFKKQSYRMECVPAAQAVRCTGGESAVIVFRPAS